VLLAMLTFALQSSPNQFLLQGCKILRSGTVLPQGVSAMHRTQVLDLIAPVFFFDFFCFAMMPVTTTAQADRPPHKIPSMMKWRYLSMEVNTSPQAIQYCSASSVPGKLSQCLNIKGSKSMHSSSPTLSFIIILYLVMSIRLSLFRCWC